LPLHRHDPIDVTGGSSAHPHVSVHGLPPSVRLSTRPRANKALFLGKNISTQKESVCPLFYKDQIFNYQINN
jgi:hypothetical protein